MKQLIMICALIGLTATGAQAACVVTYKAKSDNPLRLYHEQMTIDGPCDRKAAKQAVQAQLRGQGLTLLKIISVREE